MYTQVRKECLEAILNVDREKASNIIEDWVNINGYVEVLELILEITYGKKLGQMVQRKM